MIIYKTTNLVNGKQYIGRDSRNNPNYLGSGSALKNAILKYGKHNFKKEIIEECNDVYHLIEREEYWLNYYDAGNNHLFYNVHNCAGNFTAGRYHPMFGKTTPLHVRRKIRESMMGVKNHFYGKHHSEESRKKMSKYQSSKTLSEDHKQKISKASKDEKNGNFRGYVVCIDGGYVGQKMMMKEWCHMLNIKSSGNFSDHLSGKKFKNGIKGNFFKWEHELQS